MVGSIVPQRDKPRDDADWLRQIIETRLDGMDKALELIQTKADKVPSETDLAVARLRELHDERFKGVDTQFIASKDAVSTALASAKEAVASQNVNFAARVDKSEAATNKQIDGISTLIGQTTKATDEKIADIKDRLTAIESVKKGADNTWAYIVAGVGALAGVAGIVALILK